MTAPTRPRYVDGQRVTSISLYADKPVVRYRLHLDDGRDVIRTGDQIDAENPDFDYAAMTDDQLEWSDYGRGRIGLVHIAVGAVAFLCVVGIGVLYALRVGVWG